MPSTSRTEVYDVNINKFYEVIVDYESYPEFVDGCDEVEILESSENGAKVKYSLNLLKTFSYVLDLKHERPHRVSWTLDSGDIFKTNTGSWELKSLGEEETEVTYTLDVSFKLMVPKMILNKLVSKNLPAMMNSYYERVKSK